jgi:MFS family permease
MSVKEAYLKNIFRLFQHEIYKKYFFYQLFSYIGTWVQSTAQSWLIYKLTNSAFFLGLVGFAGSLPALLLAPFSGVVSDQFKKRNVLLITQILCLSQVIILAALYFTHIINKWHILFLAVLLGIVNSFDVTARLAFIPFLVSRNGLINAIALNSSMFNVARIIGPSIAGILIASFNEGLCFLINLVSYIPIILFIGKIPDQEKPVKGSIAPLFHLKEGVEFVFSNKPVKMLLMLVGVSSFCGMSYASIMPIFSDQILHSGAKGLGYLMGCSGIGAVCGGIYLANRSVIYGVKKIIAFCSVLFPICLLGFSFSKIFYLSAFLLFIMGFCFMIINAGSNTLLQSMSPDSLRGRIIGFYSMMFMGMFPLGSLTVGCLAHNFGASIAVSAGAVTCLIFGLYFCMIEPKLSKEAKILYEAKCKLDCVEQTS